MNAHLEDTYADVDLIVDRVIRQARSNDALAATLCRQALWLLEALNEAQPIEQATSRPPAPVTPGTAKSPLDPYLELAAACRLKARAADWLARAVAGENPPLQERELMIREAGNLGVFLWIVTPQPHDDLCYDAVCYRRLTDAYLACADALEMWKDLPPHRARELLLLVAEAQSMIRVAAKRVGYQRTDDTAAAVYRWLRDIATHTRTYIPRYMRAGETADPALAADLRERVATLLDPLHADQLLPPPARMEDPGFDDDDESGVPAQTPARADHAGTAETATGRQQRRPVTGVGAARRRESRG